ncbi:hypothetical protein PCASD_24247 [Puccinia coronata f. sp. avenae]|uniref:Uncharacterized protein n=1 Tax=Puccinia coronata f. sp. avenae TaxID=200324 RepID=A0A2N5THT7_9BASI|nr:hypothetical protein PCASD_24247 [Puccinia coronata f. sp. avenae]
MSVPENHILYPLMPWRRQAAYNMCRGSNYAPRWTKSIAPPRLKYLQLDGVLNHILPLVDPTNPTRPTKAAVRAFLTRFTLEDFDRRPNPPYTYPARAPLQLDQRASSLHTLRNGSPLSDLGMAGSHNTSIESADTMADVPGAAHPLQTVNISSCPVARNLIIPMNSLADLIPSLND